MKGVTERWRFAYCVQSGYSPYGMPTPKETTFFLPPVSASVMPGRRPEVAAQDHGIAFDADDPPYEDPEKFLAFLRWYHDPRRMKDSHIPDYDYSMFKITPHEVALAVAAAKVDGKDPRALSPAEIYFFQRNPSSSVQQERERRDRQQQTWEMRLAAHREALDFILCPDKRIFIHATSRSEAAQILRSGLTVLSGGTIQSTAKGLARLRLTGNETPEQKRTLFEAVTKENLQTLTHPHKGQPCLVVIQLPELTSEQQDELKRSDGLHIGGDATQFYIDQTTTKSGDVRNFVDAKYILGCLDLDTGVFQKNQ